MDVMDKYDAFNGTYETYVIFMNMSHQSYVADSNVSRQSSESDDIWDASFTQSALSEGSDIVIGIYMTGLAILSLVLNGTVLLTFLKNRKALSAMDMCITNLMLVGVFPALTAYPFSAISAFSHGWQFSKTSCARDATVVYFCGMVEIGNLVLLSVLRCFKTRAMPAALPVTRKQVGLMIFGTYIYGAIWALPPIFSNWARYTLEPYKLACSLAWTEISYQYLILIMILGYVLPLTFLLTCYIYMLWKVKNMRSSQLSSSPNGSNKINVSMAKMVVLMCIGYTFVWTPYAIFSFLGSFHIVDYTNPSLTTIPSLFAKSSTILNPIIYFYMVKRFRNIAKDTILSLLKPLSNFIFLVDYFKSHKLPRSNSFTKMKVSNVDSSQQTGKGSNNISTNNNIVEVEGKTFVSPTGYLETQL